MRALFLNDYSLKGVLGRVEKGVDHSAHLWGYDYFARQGSADIAPFNAGLLALQRRSGLLNLFGDLVQEAAAFWRRKSYDVIISANINAAWGLGRLRHAGLPPVIAVLHSLPAVESRWQRNFLKRHLETLDGVVCLSKKDRDYAEELGVGSGKLHWIPWSAHCSDYDRHRSGAPPAGKPYILSMGKSQRDYPLLVRAFRELAPERASLKIFAGGSYDGADAGNNVEVINEWVAFKDSIPFYQHSLFVVIPMRQARRTLGLTSFYDALAMGKAVVATRNEGIDIDIEKEKIGYWVKPGDPEDLKDKIKRLLDDPETTALYGRNARRAVEAYGYRDFCEKLHALASRLARERNRG